MVSVEMVCQRTFQAALALAEPGTRCRGLMCIFPQYRNILRSRCGWVRLRPHLRWRGFDLVLLAG